MTTRKEVSKICDCGRTTNYGQTRCHRCTTQAYRAEDLQPRVDVQSRFALQGKRGVWPTEGEQWIELQMLHGTDLNTYLRSRAQVKRVWPDTDHSLSCWMEGQRNELHRCRCGAERAS